MHYQELADHSRVWIYQSDRKLNEEEVTQIKAHGERFINEWAAHGTKLKASFDVFYNRFLILFVDEKQAMASGCSIDSSVHFIKEVGAAYGLDLFDRMIIAFKVGEQVDTLRMNDFQEALDKGQIKDNTIVFNNLVETKAEFDASWEVPLRESWHQRMLVK